MTTVLFKCGIGGAHDSKPHVCCIVFDAYKWDHDLPQHGCFEAVFHFHRASLGLVPSIHTLDGPVTSKLKQGTATVSCSSLTERTVVLKE